MEIRLAQAQDIDAWMSLVEQVRDVFPGLETTEATEEHRSTVLGFMKNSSAVCAAEADRIADILLFSRDPAELCFLAAIMAVLIVYCLKDIAVDWKANALPKILAVLTVGISYKWKHNTLISIAAGTAIYMVLIRMI